jgi:Flp pilus assembly protein TadG
MVAGPFMLLIFAILETAMVFFAGQALETAVADASRLILTGQAQTQGMSQTKFKDAVCARVFGLFDCQSAVYVDVKKFSSFTNVEMPNPVDGQGNLQNSFDYQPGGPGDIVVVRLFYKWPVQFSTLATLGLANLSGQKRLLVATSAFRNEPYASASTTPWESIYLVSACRSGSRASVWISAGCRRSSSRWSCRSC